MSAVFHVSSKTVKGFKFIR